MTKNNIFKRSICLVLLLSILLSALSVLPTFAQGDEYHLDYSDPNDDFNISVSPSELLSLLYPTSEISTAEAEYVDTYIQQVLLYNENISPTNVTAKVADGKVNVSTKKHTYTAANGMPVSWIPSFATYAGHTLPLEQSGSEYVCSFDILSDAAVTVNYTCSLAISSAFISKLSNFAYNEFNEASQISEQYAQALNAYQKAKLDYENYLSACDEYLLQSELFEEYLIKKQAYEKSLEEYNTYLSLLKKYEDDLKAYNDYEKKYQDYLTQKSEYEKKLAEINANNEAYKEYLVNLGKIRASMVAVESIYAKPENNVGTLFKALQNAEIIGMIERHQQKLVDFYGVKKSDIQAMRKASDELTNILIEYNDARNTSEEAAFAFYKAHYHEITQKFNYLYDKMTTVLTKTIFLHVCTLLEQEYKNDKEMAEYKKWRIRNVLCHIYLICEALDDNATSKSTWTFYQDNGDKHTYDFSDLIAKNVIITDTNSSCPDALEWQNGEKLGVLELPSPPVRPTEVLKPSEPIAISQPKEPAAVIKPTEPKPVAPAGEKPTLSEDEQNLIRRTSSLAGTTLTQRAQVQSNTVSFEKSIVRPFDVNCGSVVAYYGHGGELLSIGEEPPAPEPPEHPQYVYEFFYWTETNVGGDKIYTPVFEKKSDEQKNYTVIFKESASATSALYTCECSYGEIPQYQGETPTKASTKTEDFIFSGWYPQVMPTKGNITYIAQFESSTRLYEISFSVLDKTTTKSMAYGETPTPPTVKSPFILNNAYYTFLGWNRAISSVTTDVTYTANFSAIKLAEGDENLTVTETEDSFLIETNSPSISISGVIAIANNNNKDLKITLGDIVLKISTEAVASLRSNGVHGLSFISTLKVDQASAKTAVGFRFVNSSGKAIKYDGSVYLSFPHGEESTENLFLRYSFDNGEKGKLPCSLNGDIVEFLAEPNTYYSIDRYYAVAVSCGEGGAVFTDSTLYASGDYVGIKVLPNAEMLISKITLTDASGAVKDITSTKAFYMPIGNVTVNVEFKVKTYTITFISNGEVIDTKEHVLGDAITPPDIPASFEKDGFFYAFIGWDKPLSVVTEDQTYTARYNKILSELKTEASTESASQKVVKSHLVPIAIVGVVVLTSLGGFTTVVISFIRKTKKSKK